MPDKPDDIEIVTDIPDRPKRRRPIPNLFTTVAVSARKNPAEWVVLRGYRSSAVASRLRAGDYPAINPDDHEIEMRRSEDGTTWDLYVKYTGKIVK